jgi:transcriptional regulator with XRE-family HTH domain
VRSKKLIRNKIGPQIRRLRNEKNWTQDLLAARCARFGLDLSRGTLSKIEAQLRYVTDTEITALMGALGVDANLVFKDAVTKS